MNLGCPKTTVRTLETLMSEKSRDQVISRECDIVFIGEVLLKKMHVDVSINGFQTHDLTITHN